MFVDIKVNIWKRVHFDDNITDINSIIEALKNEEIEDIFDPDKGFKEVEFLYDTENIIPIEENNGQPTIEVYSEIDGEIVWQNIN